MGHNTLARIPGTRNWKAVVSLLGEGASASNVIAASATAAERDMLSAANDPVFVEAVRLLLSVPHAARSDDFAEALRNMDLRVQQDPNLLDLVLAVTDRLEIVRKAGRASTDFGELAARALASTLSSSVGSELPGLFEATPGDVQAAAKTFSWAKGVSELSRRFFGRLVSETLSYWLDRTLSDQIGPEARFKNAADKSAFDRELENYTAEATRIIQEFSGGWYGKTLHRDGGISTHSAAVFGAVALKKVVEELRVRDGRNA